MICSHNSHDSVLFDHLGALVAVVGGGIVLIRNDHGVGAVVGGVLALVQELEKDSDTIPFGSATIRHKGIHHTARQNKTYEGGHTAHSTAHNKGQDKFVRR